MKLSHTKSSDTLAAKMSTHFLSLPATILTNIWCLCEAKDIMAISSTCRTFHTIVESSMLLVDAELVSSPTERPVGIPIFFSDQCHSVFLTCKLRINKDHEQDYRIVVLSRPKHQKGPFDQVVWETTKPNDDCDWLTFEISFRNDPSQEYLLRRESLKSDHWLFLIQLHKQFMTLALTPQMKGALTTCLNMGCLIKDAWYPIKAAPWNNILVTQFFMKLFVLGFQGLPEAKSLIHRFFESGARSTRPRNIHLLEEQIINLFEQILEQKEPSDCRKKSILSTSINCSFEPDVSHRDRDVLESPSQTCFLPQLPLKKELKWRHDKRRHFDQEEDISCQTDELVFVARIPLASKTTGFRWIAINKTPSPACLFVVFFQKRESDVANKENPIDGKVFPSSDMAAALYAHLDVNPEYEACYVYALPGNNASRMELYGIKVLLEIEEDDRNRALCHWMKCLLESYRTLDETASVSLRLFPIVLLRACALALAGPDGEHCIELKELFDKERIDTTPKGLQCIIEICDALLQE